MLHIYSTGKSSAERIQYELTTADSEADSHYSTWILMLLHKSTECFILLMLVHPKSTLFIAVAKYPSRQSWCQLQSLGDISCNYICFFSKTLISKWKSLKLAFCYLKWPSKLVFLLNPTRSFQLSMYYQIPDVSNQAVSNDAMQYKISLRHKSSSIFLLSIGNRVPIIVFKTVKLQ